MSAIFNTSTKGFLGRFAYLSRLIPTPNQRIVNISDLNKNYKYYFERKKCNNAYTYIAIWDKGKFIINRILSATSGRNLCAAFET